MGRVGEEDQTSPGVLDPDGWVDRLDLQDGPQEVVAERALFGIVGAELLLQREPGDRLGALQPQRAKAPPGEPHVDVHLERRAEGPQDRERHRDRMGEDLLKEVLVEQEEGALRGLRRRLVPPQPVALDRMNPASLEEGRGEREVGLGRSIAETGEGDVDQPMELLPQVDQGALGSRRGSDPQLVGELGEGPGQVEQRTPPPYRLGDHPDPDEAGIAAKGKAHPPRRQQTEVIEAAATGELVVVGPRVRQSGGDQEASRVADWPLGTVNLGKQKPLGSRWHATGPWVSSV